MEPVLAQIVGFLNVLRPSKRWFWNPQARFGKTAPRLQKAVLENQKKLKKPMKIPKLCDQTGTMFTELAHEQKRTKMTSLKPR